MNKIKKILVVFFVFLCIITSAHAQDYAVFSGKFYNLKQGEEKIEFEFYNGTYNVCEYEKKTIPILVVNKDANIDSKYSLSASGAGWINLNAEEFSLPRKQSGVVLLDLSPGQKTNGKYSVKVNALSSVGDVKKDLSIEINVEKCYSLNLELEKEDDKVCGGVKKQYFGEIINDGKQKSDIELSIDGPNWINVDKNFISLAPNSKERFELKADLPANAKGTFSVFVSAVAKNLPSIKSERKLSIEVVPKYDCYKADVITDVKITNYYTNEFVPIKIRNDGIKQANYEISIDAPNWISIEPKKFSVNPEQIVNLNLNINPNAEVPEGAYAVKLNVKFEDIVYSKNIDVVLGRGKFLKWLKSFFVFYQYYFYVILFIIIILFIFRGQISNKIKIKYKNYKINQARLKALEAARKARQLKKQLKEIEETKKAEFKQKSKKYTGKWILYPIAVIVITSILFFSIYQFDFPIPKNFVKNYYLNFI
ncbi:MAG: hypothetical protein Q8R04_06765, partial [Nanoarchaeota archaeon]|nr:hypothetical protein [Nanoarchaeota archaeon]